MYIWRCASSRCCSATRCHRAAAPAWRRAALALGMLLRCRRAATGFPFAQQRVPALRHGAADRTQPSPRRSPPRVMTDSPRPAAPAGARASASVLGRRRRASRRRIARGPRTLRPATSPDNRHRRRLAPPPAPGARRRVRPAPRPAVPGPDDHRFDQLASAPSTAFSQPASTCRRSPTRRPSSGHAPAATGWRALSCPRRGVLQGFQRRQAAAGGLRLLAQFGQFDWVALPLPPRQLACLRASTCSASVPAFLLGVVLELQLLEGIGQRVEVQAWRASAFATVRGGDRRRGPGDQVFDAIAFHVAGARNLGLLAAVRVPALLPVGQRRFRPRARRPGAAGRSSAAVPAAARPRPPLRATPSSFCWSPLMCEPSSASADCASSRRAQAGTDSSRWWAICCSTRASVLLTW